MVPSSPGSLEVGDAETFVGDELDRFGTETEDAVIQSGQRKHDESAA